MQVLVYWSGTQRSFWLCTSGQIPYLGFTVAFPDTMAPVALETEDHSRDAQFNKAMHGASATEGINFMAMLKKDSKAQKATVDEYFKHWDNKSAAVETEEDREVPITALPAMLRNVTDAHTILGQENPICNIDQTVRLQRRVSNARMS